LQTGNPELLLYNAIAWDLEQVVVSNGRHTDNIFTEQKLIQGPPEEVFGHALGNHNYEPDAPNFTPRIAGLFLPAGGAFLGIIKNSDGERVQEVFPIEEGEMMLLTTYEGTNPPSKEDPLPPFPGAPLKVNVSGTAEEVATSIWELLNPEFKVSLTTLVFRTAGRPDVCIFNKNK
jgi:IMP cyclohydrolase